MHYRATVFLGLALIGSSVLPGCSQRSSDVAQTAQPEPASVQYLRVEVESQAAGESRQLVDARQQARVQQAAVVDPAYGFDRERYLGIDPNPVQVAIVQPVSTFSVDVDTAAYSNIRRMLATEGRLPPANAVRTEELVNYFEYDYSPPRTAEVPFSVSTEVAPSPWSAGRHLLRIALRGYEPPAELRPAANLVFLVDVSGSMNSADKLPLVQQSLEMLVRQLDSEDRIALVVYAGAAGLVLDSTSGDRKSTILSAIQQLRAGGSTNGGSGIRLAYQVAREHFIEGGINRVLIASDGDLNVGTVDLDALKDLVAENRRSGVTLTTLGFGSGNYNDALMEQLADIGNGNAAYIDSLREAHRVLVSNLHSTLLTIASDVKIQVEFNPAQVAEYRLIGYENRLLGPEEFRNDRVDAGEIGAGHTVTALYELVLVENVERSGWLVPRRYSELAMQNRSSGVNGELGYVRLRFKKPDDEKSQEIGSSVTRSGLLERFEQASEDFRFAAAVAAFGERLRGGDYSGSWDYDEILAAAQRARGFDPDGYRGEFVGLVRLAREYSEHVRLGSVD